MQETNEIHQSQNPSGVNWLAKLIRHGIVRSILLVGAALALAYYLYKDTETARQQKWIGSPTSHPETIYNGQTGSPFIAPFVMDYQPMKRLALFNFDNHPDTVYRDFEIQYFDDDLHGKGFLVIAYRNDRKVDVYFQTGLKLTSNYDEAEGGLADKLERPMSTTRFEITPQTTAVDFAFEDKLGRPIKVHLLEDYRSKKRTPFDLLAPLGSGTQNPPAFPLYLMKDMSVVRQANTELSIEIDGKKMIPDPFPIPFKGDSSYLIRFTSNPIILNWNKNYSGALQVFQPQGQSTLTDRGNIYTLVNNKGHIEIGSIRPDKVEKDVRIDFYPSFPELSSFGDGKQVKGNFTVWLGASMGQIDGTYHVSRSGNRIQMQMQPKGGWRVGSHDPWLHLLFTFAPSFRNWPKNYLWSASLDLTTPNAPQIQSQWSKIR